MIPKATSCQLTYTRFTYETIFNDGTSLIFKVGYSPDDEDLDLTVLWLDNKGNESTVPDWAKTYSIYQLQSMFTTEE